MVRLFDTRTGSLQPLPDPPAKIGMYVCGPTVYQRAHIGNARPFVVFSWLCSWLRHTGYEPNFVHNITDVNDKIYAASPNGSNAHAAKATAWYIEDIEAFGLGLPDAMPRVTECIGEIITLIQTLIDDGHAYAAGGDVYFRVSSFSVYGELSRRTGAELINEEPDSKKLDPRDFALWKATKPGEDTWWESPWGPGRPGWHIECSAMAAKHLGDEFEIHGGGIDLLFPHHENELAQSRSAGQPFARLWLHNGMLEFGGEKMSKSAGNVASIREALDDWGTYALLIAFLGAHWHGPMEFSAAAMEAAEARIDTFLEATATVPATAPSAQEWDRAGTALNENFNTPAALAVAHDWAGRGYHELNRRLLGIFGLGVLATPVPVPHAAMDLGERRTVARAKKRFNESDSLRSELQSHGWMVQDSASGTTLVPTYKVIRASSA